MKARNIFFSIGTCMIPIVLYNAEPNFMIHPCDSVSPLEKKIGYIFAHGLGATQAQAALFLSNSTNKWLINKPLIVFDFPDSKNNAMEYYCSEVNLGQELDIARLKEAYDKAKSLLENHRFVLAGISRGSATVINYVALHQPASIAALVLESPFDTISNVIKHLLRRFHINWIPFSKKIAIKLAQSNFPLLNINGIFPLNVVHKIPSHIPIFIIHSRKDRTIPINSSRNLYRSLVLAGHNHVYFLELASGEHGKLAYSIESDLYAYVVHAFYKKYGLPHNVQYALHGENMLKHCQPTVEEINKKIKKSKGKEDFLNDDDTTTNFEALNYDIIEKNNHFELDISPFRIKLDTIF